MTLLQISDLSVTLRQRDVLRDVSFDVAPGEFVGLIGPNGAGKTTLMRAALGLLPCDGRSSLADLPDHARARMAAWMPQAREIAWPVTVESVVALGRMPHQAAFQRATAEDRQQVEQALARMDLLDMRALIARVLAQDTPLIMADEPTAGLDPAHQIATMQTFRRLAEDGRSCIVSLHDLGLAARHCTRLILLGDGGLVADGPPEAVLTPERLARIFGVTAACQITEHGILFQPLDVIDTATATRSNAPFEGRKGEQE